FAHVGACQDELESTTSAALRHVLDSAAAQGTEHRLPLKYKARDPRAGNKNFPFSSHDNKDSICNSAEYFDLVSI
ncbi:TEX36 protein, partial [Formicarius rufipectus]|nr:TEX36 protein [Formicarius rufipectus]